MILRLVAGIVFAAVILVVVIGFYYGSFRREFRMKGLPAVLSDNVVAVVDGYSRKESEGSQLKYSISAEKATTFDDKHQELEDVVLRVYVEGDNSRFDSLKAQKAIYLPDGSDPDAFKVFFAGDVVIDTRDHLNIKTEQLTYLKSTETAEAEEYVEFSRENISGNSVGAVVKIDAKTLELLKDVRINSAPADEHSEFASKDIHKAELSASRAFVDQVAGTIELTGNVSALIVPNPGKPEFDRPARFSAPRATAFIENKELRRVELTGGAKMKQQPGTGGRATNASADKMSAHVTEGVDRIELNGNVAVETASGGSPPTKISSKFAVYDRPEETFDLGGNVAIETSNAGKATKAKADKAVYRQISGEVMLSGNASVEQGADSVGGDIINAVLHPDRSLKNADVRGNAYLSQNSPERKGILRAPELRAGFTKDGKIRNASAAGMSVVEVTPLDSPDYSRYTLRSPQGITMVFGRDGKPGSLQTEGRTTINLTAADTDKNASDKTLTADNVSTSFKQGTDELETASAAGDAELVITPRNASNGDYRTEVRSPRFDCDFFPGNNARSCTGKGRGEAKRVPVGDPKGREVQTLEADSFYASFDKKSKDISTLEARGNSKFSEGERNGIAANIKYNAGNETVSLRGGDPKLWDDTGRVRAAEIDWDLKKDTSAYSGKVSATYYAQRKARGATPFAKVNSPVFVSSDSAQFDHRRESAVFTGDARAWQEKNYVRADKLVLEQQTSRFSAEGAVQSLLYDAKRTVGGKRSSVPVYAQADSMVYVNGDRTLRYEGNVDIRQGTDRIRAGIASVYLDKSNDLSQTIVERNVVITQPGRRATGDYAKYDAGEELIVLRGSPASVRDEERGSSEGREVVVNLKNNSVIGTGKSGDKGTGRIRSVYKLKDTKLN